MEKVMIGKMPANAFPAAIAGAMVNGKPNYNMLGCYGMMSITRPTVYIMSMKSHYTNIGIHESGYYSINIPSPGEMQKADYVGMVSGKDTDKSRVFSSFFGTIDKAPMARECPVNALCKVTGTIEVPGLPTNEVFIGEVLEVYVSQECMTDGEPDIKKINPLLMAGKSYWDIGEPVGGSWMTGMALVKNKK